MTPHDQQRFAAMVSDFVAATASRASIRFAATGEGQQAVDAHY
jgi:hypothetical protein